MKKSVIKYASIILGGFIEYCCAQVSYDPHYVVGWNAMPQYDSYILSPYDIISDQPPSDTLPPRFRSPQSLPVELVAELSLKGKYSIRISGSGQFSEGQLAALVHYLQQNYQVKPNKIVVVDLREEPHGFINKEAVTFYYGPLTLKRNQSVATALADDWQRIQFVMAASYVLIHHITKGKDGMPNNKLPTIRAVKSVATEQEVAKKLGVQYVRIPVTDHFRPDNHEVDHFINLVNSLDLDSWLHVKCRGGKGRTTTFMVMYDMLKNPTLNKEDFFKRQVIIGGIDLSKVLLLPEKEWKRNLSMDRTIFLNRFYEYLQASDGYGKYKWSDWVVMHYPGSLDETYESIID